MEDVIHITIMWNLIINNLITTNSSLGFRQDHLTPDIIA